MLPRRLSTHLQGLLRHSPAVLLWGPRQVGKTILALEIGEQQASIYLDLEDEDDRAKLSNPARYLADHESELVILDEVHRVPELELDLFFETESSAPRTDDLRHEGRIDDPIVCFRQLRSSYG